MSAAGGPRTLTPVFRSFFGAPRARPASDKGGEENPAKTKDTGAAAGGRTSKTDAKKARPGVIGSDSEEELPKENCKNGANTEGGPLPLDAEGLPPLRKTAANPAFKRKSEGGSWPPKSPKKGAKAKPESPVKGGKKAKVEATKSSPNKESEVAEEEQMDVDDSPVKLSKKKKAVIDSDSEDESPKKKKESPKKKVSPAKEDKEHKEEKKKTSPAKEDVKEEKPKVSSFFNPKSKATADKKKEAAQVEKKDSPEKKDKENKDSPEKKDKEKKDSPEKKPDVSEKEAAKPKAAVASFFAPKPGGAKRNEGGSDYQKKVQQATYHPVEDCFWGREEPTPFLALAKTLEAIEATSGRLRTIEILSNYLRSVMVQTPADLLPSLYITLNRMAPAWHGVELGIGESLLMKAIANSTGRSVAQIKVDSGKLGDLGLVAEQSRGGQRTMFQPAHLTVRGVFGKLREIADMTGHGGGGKKVDRIQALVVACRGSEARYLIRSLAGKLRIGLAEQSVLQALAQAVVQTPTGQDYPPPVHTAFKSAEMDKFKEELGRQSLLLKTAYCECPSYDQMVPALLEVGVEGLAGRCKLTPGIPLKPMLAHPTKGIQEVLNRFENCRFTCEWKYDGERAQIHLHDDGKVNIFSRNQEDNTTKFPDIIARLKSCLGAKVRSAVLDCEAVAWDREKKTIQPFQILSTRKRKDAVEEEIKVQVCVFAFDLLYLNGETLVKKPFEERRELLRKNFKAVEGEFVFAQSMDGNTVEEIQEALEESIKDNCEGLMVKTLDVDATYEIARRSHNWLKLKKDYLEGVGDTLDLVVLGGYLGRGKRAGKYGGFLLACYEPENEEYQSICKIGTGFTDDDLAAHAAFFKDHVIEKPKAYYNFDPTLAPDHWFDAVQVWEVKCADLSVSPVHRAAMGIVDPAKGVSLRFPRFIRIRDDKKVEDATNAEQIGLMYNSQDIIKNQNKDKAGAEDDFDF